MIVVGENGALSLYQMSIVGNATMNTLTDRPLLNMADTSRLLSTGETRIERIRSERGEGAMLREGCIPGTLSLSGMELIECETGRSTTLSRCCTHTPSLSPQPLLHKLLWTLSWCHPAEWICIQHISLSPLSLLREYHISFRLYHSYPHKHIGRSDRI